MALPFLTFPLCSQGMSPPWGLRSTAYGLLVEKIPKRENTGGWPFSVCAPQLWNSPPISLRSTTSLDGFKKGLKTHLFSEDLC